MSDIDIRPGVLLYRRGSVEKIFPLNSAKYDNKTDCIVLNGNPVLFKPRGQVYGFRQIWENYIKPPTPINEPIEP